MLSNTPPAGVDPRDVVVPVVGGHAGITILPLLSQVCVWGKHILYIHISSHRHGSHVAGSSTVMGEGVSFLFPVMREGQG